jgi:plasmid stabilization system protein ParE
MAKKTKIQYSPVSKADISEIHAIIAEVNRPAANRTRKGIGELVGHLHSHPLMGAELNSICYIPTPFRFLVYEKYLIFYTYTKTQDTVQIHRVLNGTTNYLSVLLRDYKEFTAT